MTAEQKKLNDSIKRAGLDGMTFFLYYLREIYEQNNGDIVLTHENWQKEINNIDSILHRFNFKGK